MADFTACEYSKPQDGRMRENVKVLKAIFFCIMGLIMACCVGVMVCALNPSLTAMLAERVESVNPAQSAQDGQSGSGLCMDKGVLIAPNVTISTTNHLMHYKARTHGEMYCKKVVIEDYVWIGSNVVISAGVMIGKGSVIGAGSVVTRDVPPMFCSRRTL